MDDQFTYLLNGLITRDFGLGRIARFRQVSRGRQAATYEILTAQQNEYLVYLYPPTFASEHLAFVASAVNRLDESRFSVMPFLKSKSGELVISGPQQTHLMVGLNPIGAPLPAERWNAHKRSELGLRLAWLHKALREELPETAGDSMLVDELIASLAIPPDRLPRNAPTLETGVLENLAAELAAQPPNRLTYVHGDLSPESVLLDGDDQLRFVLDWGLLRPGTPTEDLVWVFINWCRGDVDTMREILEAYCELETVSSAAIKTAVTRAAARRIIEARAGRTAMRPALELLENRAEVLAGLEKARR